MTALLLSDPVLQLNVVLWMLQPFPDDAPVHPVLRRAGYMLESVSRELPIPVEIRPQVAELAGNSHAPSPDVIAETSGPVPFLVTECKGHSFGPESTNRIQAIKLLAIGSDLTRPLARSANGNKPGFLAYLTVHEEAPQMSETLAVLRHEVESAGLAAAQAGTFGILRSDEGLAIELHGGNWPEAIANSIVGQTTVLRVSREDDPRPLYLIPWDPSVQQDPEMALYCQTVLFARLLTEAAAQIGKSTVPDRVILDVDDLLARATFGVFKRWRSRGDVGKMRSVCQRKLLEVLKPLNERLSVSGPHNPDRVELNLHSKDDQRVATEALIDADPSRSPADEVGIQANLFDTRPPLPPPPPEAGEQHP